MKKMYGVSVGNKKKWNTENHTVFDLTKDEAYEYISKYKYVAIFRIDKPGFIYSNWTKDYLVAVDD